MIRRVGESTRQVTSIIEMGCVIATGCVIAMIEASFVCERALSRSFRSASLGGRLCRTSVRCGPAAVDVWWSLEGQSRRRSTLESLIGQHPVRSRGGARLCVAQRLHLSDLTTRSSGP